MVGAQHNTDCLIQKLKETSPKANHAPGVVLRLIDLKHLPPASLPQLSFLFLSLISVEFLEEIQDNMIVCITYFLIIFKAS